MKARVFIDGEKVWVPSWRQYGTIIKYSVSALWGPGYYVNFGGFPSVFIRADDVKEAKDKEK